MPMEATSHCETAVCSRKVCRCKVCSWDHTQHSCRCPSKDVTSPFLTDAVYLCARIFRSSESHQSCDMTYQGIVQSQPPSSRLVGYPCWPQEPVPSFVALLLLPPPHSAEAGGGACYLCMQEQGGKCCLSIDTSVTHAGPSNHLLGTGTFHERVHAVLAAWQLRRLSRVCVGGGRVVVLWGARSGATTASR
jgi:hypothetical protein